MQGVNSFDPVLIPPRELIIQNGIGAGNLDNVEMEFDSIGKASPRDKSKTAFLPSHTVLECELGTVAKGLGAISGWRIANYTDCTGSS